MPAFNPVYQGTYSLYPNHDAITVSHRADTGRGSRRYNIARVQSHYTRDKFNKFIRIKNQVGCSGRLLRLIVEQQVDLGANEGVSVQSRPDFVLWPTQSHSLRRPVAIFCDGWAYHQSSTREDANKRSALVASGKFWVWSVTWDDVQSAMQGKLDSTLADSLAEMYFNAKGQVSLRSMLDDSLWTQHAVAVLLHWLSKPTGEAGDQHVNKIARHAGATAFLMIPNPGNPLLEEARAKLAQFWSGLHDLPCERPDKSVACGNVNNTSLMLRYYWSNELANLASAIPASPGFVIFNDAHCQSDPERHLLWRRWLWLYNIFQTLPGVLLATQAGMEAGDYSAITIATGTRPVSNAQGSVHAAAWERVIEQSMGYLAEGLNVLLAAGLPPADEVGYEFEQDGNVVAEAELAWLPRKLVLLLPVHAGSASVWQANGWKTLVAEDEWPQRLVEELGSAVQESIERSRNEH